MWPGHYGQNVTLFFLTCELNALFSSQCPICMHSGCLSRVTSHCSFRYCPYLISEDFVLLMNLFIFKPWDVWERMEII